MVIFGIEFLNKKDTRIEIFEICTSVIESFRIDEDQYNCIRILKNFKVGDIAIFEIGICNINFSLSKFKSPFIPVTLLNIVCM